MESGKSLLERVKYVTYDVRRIQKFVEKSKTFGVLVVKNNIIAVVPNFLDIFSSDLKGIEHFFVFNSERHVFIETDKAEALKKQTTSFLFH